MKKIRSTFLLIASLVAVQAGIAQYPDGDNAPARPRWYSEKGFWMVESNINNPKNSIVRFYNNDQRLIYTENVYGVELNTKKRRTLMKLKRVLEKVVFAWEVNGTVKNEGELTALLTKSK